MPQYNQPGRLETLSQITIAKSISQLCLSFAKPNPAGYLEAAQVCKELQDRFHNHLSQILANNFTLEIVKHLDDLFEDIKYYIRLPHFQEKLKLLLQAVLHPKINTLDLSWNWSYIAYFIIELIGSLNELRVLKLTNGHPFKAKYIDMSYEERWTQYLATNLQLHRNLDTLSIRYSGSDELLEIISKSNVFLRILDVRNSQKVTDKCIKHILKFPRLQQLNLSGTSVTKDGYLAMLRKCSLGSANILNSFGFDCYSSRQLRSTVRGFINLAKVSLFIKSCNMSVSVLSSLDFIQVLKVKCLTFDKLQNLLLIKGHQLLKLKLEMRFMVEVDLKIIAEHCPHLQSLKILGDTDVEFPDDCYNFPFLTSITIQTHEVPFYTLGEHVQTRNANAIEYLLSRCPNLRRLSLCTVKKFYEENLGNVFNKNSMEKLKELTISTLSENLQPQVLRSVTEHCKTLNKFTVYAHSRYIKVQLKSFPGVNFIPFKFRNLNIY